MPLTQVPGAMISPDSSLPAGVGPIPYLGSTAPTGWIFCDGRTIGSAASSATNRANSDTLALFTVLWNSLSNSVAPVSGGRGASAAADFSANKTLTLPDCRGRVAAFKDDMGGSAAGRLTATGIGNPNIDGTVLGASGGVDRHTLTVAQMPAHTHTLTNAAGAGGNSAAGGAGSGYPTSSVTASNGGDNAHPNVQPTIVTNALVKL